VIAELERLTGIETRRIHVDEGYRGHNHKESSGSGSLVKWAIGFARKRGDLHQWPLLRSTKSHGQSREPTYSRMEMGPETLKRAERLYKNFLASTLTRLPRQWSAAAAAIYAVSGLLGATAILLWLGLQSIRSPFLLRLRAPLFWCVPQRCPLSASTK
jgi:hypothetical protein